MTGNEYILIHFSVICEDAISPKFFNYLLPLFKLNNLLPKTSLHHSIKNSGIKRLKNSGELAVMLL